MESVPNLTKSKSDISGPLANTKYHEITDTYMKLHWYKEYLVLIFLKKRFSSFRTWITTVFQHSNNGWWFSAGINVAYALLVDMTILQFNSQFYRMDVVAFITKDINIVVSH